MDNRPAEQPVARHDKIKAIRAPGLKSKLERVPPTRI